MRWSELLDEWTKDYLPDLPVVKDEPMSRHTSFRVGGPAARMAFPDSGEQLVLLMGFAEENHIRTLVIGNGTNLLIPDEGLDRLVVSTAGLNRLSRTGEAGIRAGAGVPLARLADFAQKNGLTGLEFAHGIPGSVGGGVCMNAGAYGGELKQALRSVTALFPQEGVQTLDVQALRMGYRRSVFTETPDAVALEAEFVLSPGDPAAIRRTMEELMARRKAGQPLEYPSAGSTFKRPEGYYAGTLIDQCGLKGLAVGGAQVSEKHAGFVINKGNATAAEILELIRQVQERVREKTGVRLEPEVRIIDGRIV